VTAEEEPITKITFDDVTDFKFTAAYEVYSKAFDEISREEDRQQLNDLVTQLSSEEISYPRFYGEMSRFRGDPGAREFRRVRIQGQRKRAYRRDQQKRDRIKRHKR